MTVSKRVQLDLPEKSLIRLQELRSQTDAASYAEVIKNALRLYEAVVREAQAGSTFLVKSPDGEVKQYLVF